MVDCAHIVTGQSPSSEFYNNVGEGLPFYQGKTEFGDYLLDVPKIWTKEVTRISVKDDILFSMRAPVGSINKNPFDKICIGRGLAAIRPNESINKNYLFYFLLFNQNELSKKGNSGSVFNSITKEQLESIAIPLPPFQVQQKIVAEIEQYQKVITGCDLITQNYKSTFKIDESWEKIMLDEVCFKITDGSHYSPPTSSSGYPYITVKDLSNDKIDFSSCEFINQKEYDKLVKCDCKPFLNDVLFSKDGTIGKVCLIDFEKDFVVLSSLAIIRPDLTKVLSQYLFALFKSDFFMDQALNIKKGVAIKRIIIRDLKQLTIPLPSLEEQLRIGEQIQSEMRAIEKCKHLKTQMENKIKEIIDSLWQTSPKESLQ